MRRKGFNEVFEQLDADFFCLQETKMQEGQLDINFQAISRIGTMPKKKAIQELLYLQDTSRWM